MKYFTSEFTIKWDSLSEHELMKERENLVTKIESCPKSSISVIRSLNDVLEILNEYIRRRTDKNYLY